MAGLGQHDTIIGYRVDELRRLLALRDEVMHVLRPGADRPRRIANYLALRRLAQCFKSVEPANDP